MGFSYPDWLGPFYPRGTKPADYLAYYSRCFNSVELDTTFYAMPDRDRLAKWAGMTPDHFRFSLKVPRDISHTDLLSRTTAEDRATDMAHLCSILSAFATASGVSKLGILVLQLPPSLPCAATAGLARIMSVVPVDIRLAVEFRHPSWWTSATEKLLTDYGAAWVSADYVGQPDHIIPTADFHYVRLIGQHERYSVQSHEQRDPTADLTRWHSRLSNLTFSGQPIKETWVMFNNDYAGHSPATADRYKQLLGQPVNRPSAPPGSLF